MENGLMLCPYCGGNVPGEATICPDCHEDLAGLARIEFEHAIYYNEALSLARNAQFAAALEKLRLSQSIRSDFMPAWVLTAKIKAKQGDWDGAQVAIQRAAQIEPGNDEVQSLETIIEDTAHDRAVAALKSQESVVMQSRDQAQRRVQIYKRDIASAFVLGMGFASVVAAILSRLGGSRRD